MHKIISFILVLGILIGGVQCSSTPAAARELTEAEKRLVESGNGFGFELFSEIVDREQDKNIFISPLSVAMALGMTLNGAAGDTREAMEAVLELSGLTEQKINESYRSLIELLADLDPEVTFQIANSIWYRQGDSFEQEFFDRATTYFGAGISELDFSDPAAVEAINGWVKDNTNGKIEEIIDKIDPDTIMYLINAIYFKGSWTYRFDAEETQDDQFTLPDGSKTECRMMNQESEFMYLDNSDFQAIALPYGNGDYSMTIFLPREGKDIDSMISEFNEANWAEWSDSFYEQELTLQLPKFTLEYELKLNDVLDALGMGIAFTPVADFTGMRSSGGLWIDEVKHKTFVEVNEEGTEAAAVTSVAMNELSAASTPCFRVDRPFAFVISENQSQTLLFMGKIVEPAL